MQILVIEDDKRISDFLTKGLEENNYLVTLCTSAEEVLNDYTNLNWDLILCDVMLPGIDGIQLVQALRFKKIFSPILMISALGAVEDKIIALDYGADDYITKPFHFDELLSRIKALTRRTQYQNNQSSEKEFQLRNLYINQEQYKVTLNDKEVVLSPREYKLLTYLVKNHNKTVSRVQIINAVWGLNFNNHTNVVDVYISYLRNKLEDDNQKFIYTVKGIGYIFK